MATAVKNQSQAGAIGEIASMLHVQRQGIAALIARSVDPLPFPPSSQQEDHFVFDKTYKMKLLCWVQKEQKKSIPEIVSTLDCELIEKELGLFSESNHWSIEEELERKIPENYIG
ncbi:MAG: hypothetical protein DWQ05_00155 [Calditrichaeota bacterium]|nr:MAG: hypothetical protein DWQ05_00155 [Calditrichota bacterium]